jgi:FMN reductase (NADPH)/FMN reductase [NAD(P)H]
MNQVMDVLLKRKSSRAYEKKEISPEIKAQILKAAMRAPTAGNLMLYSILDITDQGIKDTLAQSCDNQPFIATAPMVLLFAADYQRWQDYFAYCDVDKLCASKNESMRKPDAGDLLLACCDTLIAAQNAVIAAESFGLGSCYIGDILEQYETHKELFQLPQYVLPVCLLCFGYPTEQQKNREQPGRFDEKFIVFENKYQRLESQDFDEMFRNRHKLIFKERDNIEGSVNLGQFMYQRKFNAEYSLEMNRSVRAMLKAWNNEE